MLDSSYSRLGAMSYSDVENGASQNIGVKMYNKNKNLYNKRSITMKMH